MAAAAVTVKLAISCPFSHRSVTSYVTFTVSPAHKEGAVGVPTKLPCGLHPPVTPKPSNQVWKAAFTAA